MSNDRILGESLEIVKQTILEVMTERSRKVKELMVDIIFFLEI